MGGLPTSWGNNSMVASGLRLGCCWPLGGRLPPGALFPLFMSGLVSFGGPLIAGDGGGIILFIDGLFCRRSNAGADTAGAAGLNVSTEPGPGFCIRRNCC